MKDIFAEIAAQRLQYRDKQLKVLEPPPVPDHTLPLNCEPGASLLPESRKMSHAAELDAELDKWRRHYAPFMEDHAPELQPSRLIQVLDQFDWRKETEADQKDFSAALFGNGNWTQVTIPHYGPPLGRAATCYRTVFSVSRDMLDRGALFLCFKGVDYKAQVYINGICVGVHEGFFAPFEFDITPNISSGTNTLLVRVENDYIFMGSRDEHSTQRLEGEKLYAATGCGYDDPQIGWHHCPPGMGIYQEVRIEARSRVHLHDIFIRPLPQQHAAEAWIEVYQCDVQPQTVTLELSVHGQNFVQPFVHQQIYHPAGVYVAGLGDLDKSMPDRLPLQVEAGVNLFKIPMDLPNARAWSPETPWLYQLQVRLLDDHGRCLDNGQQHFGMRSFRMDESGEVKGGLFLNEQPIKLRGANTMGHLQQCVIKKDWPQLRDDILLAKICNMNFLRLTQRPVQPEIYDMCDKLGLMLQSDLPLFGVLRRPKITEVLRQTEEMERLLRRHPANIMVSYINEPFPNAMGKPHRHLTRAELSEFFACADRLVRMANPDRVIKAVDGDYDPPAPGLPDNHCYCGWYIGHGIDLGRLHKGYWQPVKYGWFCGCGEFGAEGLDPVALMRKYYPSHWLPQTHDEERNWNPDQIVDAQTGKFHYMWFDTQHTLTDWVSVSQAHQDWVVRLMTGALRRNRMMHSFAIHLFIDAFPSGWMKTIMDVERTPKPAWYSYRDLLEPLMVSLRCDRQAFWAGEAIAIEAWICNDRTTVPEGTVLGYQIEIGARILHAGQIPVRVPCFDAQCQGTIRFDAPEVQSRDRLRIRLGLQDASGALLHDAGLELDVFARPEFHLFRTVKVLGVKAAQLADELMLSVAPGDECTAGDLILVEDMSGFENHRAAIENAVLAGALLVLLELPVGEHRIVKNLVRVEACGMGVRHFVSRNTGHALVRDLRPEDFRFWYHAAVDHPAPLLATVLDAPDWQAILTSGNGDWQGHWRSMPAAVEKSFGAGRVRICQVQLAGRIPGNPVAEIFSRRLLHG